jgi:predicted CopG family antitoxin
MAREADNHIRVSDKTWKRLNSRKEPGDSFEDVISRLLDQTEGEEGNGNTPTETTVTAD